jgi:hypothetical protein
LSPPIWRCIRSASQSHWDGVRLKPPITYGYYKNIVADDLDAMVAYLRTLKPL